MVFFYQLDLRLTLIDLDLAVDTGFIAGEGFRFDFEVLSVLLEKNGTELMIRVRFVEIQMGGSTPGTAQVICAGDNTAYHGVVSGVFDGLMGPDDVIGLGQGVAADE